MLYFISNIELILQKIHLYHRGYTLRSFERFNINLDEKFIWTKLLGKFFFLFIKDRSRSFRNDEYRIYEYIFRGKSVFISKRFGSITRASSDCKMGNSIEK